jgi:putative membrane protein
MRNWIVRWIASAVALLIVTHVVPGIHIKNDVQTVLIVVVALGAVNMFIRPLIMFFVWPINCLTFGLLGFCINVLLFWLVGSIQPDRFKVDSPLAALIGSVAMGVLSGLINMLLKDRGDRDDR